MVALVDNHAKEQFWTLYRGIDERVRHFIIRCWLEARGAKLGPYQEPREYEAIYRADGYASLPFADELRARVWDPEAPIYQAHNVLTGGPVYYVFGEGGDGTAHLAQDMEPAACVFYDPARGPTAGRRDDTTADGESLES